MLPSKTKLHDFQHLITSEWLLTNGTGGFSMGTAAAANTRRYHGLLIAATNPPVGRVVLLNQMLETLTLRSDSGRAGVGGAGIGRAGVPPASRRSRESEFHKELNSAAPKPVNSGETGALPVNLNKIEFATCLFQDENSQRIYAPQGYKLLDSFQRGLNITWVYKHGAITFTRRLYLHFRQQAATLHYQIEGLPSDLQSAQLELSPMITLRDFHALTHCGQSGDLAWNSRHNNILLATRGDLSATFYCPAAQELQAKDQWWYNAQYPIDARRGQEDREDYFVPASFICPLETTKNGRAEVSFTVALGEEPAEPQADTAQRDKHLEPITSAIESVIQASVGRASRPSSSFPALCLAIAADDFIVQRPVKNKTLSTIIAGYPWFADWGRDTFIAMRGLLLTTGRFKEAKQVLRAFAGSIQDGLVPNRFDDYNSNQAYYNTVDGSLLFIQAALDYYQKSDDEKSWKSWLAPACISIIDSYIQGTQAGEKIKAPIKMDDDGLISAGSASTQLTWMDAASDGKPFTPRHGKAVEINALWHSALVSLSQQLPDNSADKKQRYGEIAARAKKSFGKLFWDEQKGYLADHIWCDENGLHYDWSLRPNQIFAAAVKHSPLSLQHQKKVIAAVRQNLLTPVGLKTLPANDPNYHGSYAGNQYQRDSAYHQGTIWPWLIGPYGEAVLRVGKFSDATQKQATKAIEPLLAMLTDEKSIAPGAIGQLSEIHEANSPHRAVGCPAQAWSVGELLRVTELINHNPRP